MAFVVASQIMLWAALIALAGVVIVLAREVARLKQRLAAAGGPARAVETVSVGDPAPRLSLTDLAGRAVEIGAPDSGRSQLIFYMSLGCPVCKSLLPTLTSAASSGRLDIVLASDDAGPQHRAYVAAHGLEAISYVVSEPLGAALGVSRLPHATLIDENGLIAAMAQVNSRAQLESLIEVATGSVASLQAFLAKRPAGRGAQMG
jgi:methylamine dehydrogenase accessory protein MauD